MLLMLLYVRSEGDYEDRQTYRDIENLTMWLLTFGDKVEVLEPMELREKLKTVAEAMIKMYEG